MEQNDLLSQEETDVEDLEEKVIDEKTKANKNTWKIMREKVSVVIKSYIRDYCLRKEQNIFMNKNRW